MSLSPGVRLGPYEILAVLGAGGMGEVYRARDPRLNRDVALKVLPEDFLEGEERKGRFEREARLLAALNHPGIAAVYSFEEIPGPPSSSSSTAARHILVMELVEGFDLAERLASGPLSLEETLSLARQIAGALSAAHEKGIVHRDLKPANVRVMHDGRVKILDFGLAKAEAKAAGADTDAPTASKHTQAGVVLGTVGYMSPEQARGLPVDKRTDIWAFGCVLYEMLTGRRAFEGDSAPDTMAAILRGEADLSRMPPGTPSRLVSLLRRTLQKDPSKRLRDIADALPDLEETPAGEGRAGRQVPWFSIAAAAAAVAVLAAGGVWLARGRGGSPGASSAGASVVVPSIAVLPFTNLSDDKAQEYFSDGLSEELMGLLAKAKELHVTGRTSSFAFKGKTEDLRTIGRKLNVATVLEGSVRRSGDEIRVSTQLVNVADGYQIWAETYNRKMTEIFAVQDEIAGAVVAALKVRLLRKEPPVTSRHRTSNPEAYNQFLLGRQFFNRASPEDFRRSREAYRKAIMLDPGYAAAWAGLAIAEMFVADFAETAAERDQGNRSALSAADKAISLDPELGEAFAARGFLRSGIAWDWGGARADFDRALSLQPGDSDTQWRYGEFLASCGRLAEAVAATRKAADLDPLSAPAWTFLGIHLQESGQFEEARKALARAVEINPEFGYARFSLGVEALLEGDPKGALPEFERAQAGFRPAGLAMAWHDLGQARESQRELDDLIARYSRSSAFQVAEVYAWCSQRDKAFEWLDRSVAQKDGGLVELKVDPLLARLRDDPRYAALLKRLNLPLD
ncbi:MAG TPA: protein kinase [Thermoanaerobaculia bacterium]|nr:protein kinase [Thermoanaerobaculia bacterium]